MKFISWNVNGSRACMNKGFMDFFESADADIFCLQETKPQEGQIEFAPEGYYAYWNYAEKKGYSGTAIFTKRKPISVSLGMGKPKHDNEGRLITLEFEDFYFCTVYVPNSKRELARLDYRMEWEDDFRNYILSLDAKKPVIFCGDLNVAHTEIDLKNPKRTQKRRIYSGRTKQIFTAAQQRIYRHFQILLSGKNRNIQLVELYVSRKRKECGMAHRLFCGIKKA